MLILIDEIIKETKKIIYAGSSHQSDRNNSTIWRKSKKLYAQKYNGDFP